VQHLMGYLKRNLSSDDKQELLGLIEDYRNELVPLIVPLTLLHLTVICGVMRCPSGWASRCISIRTPMNAPARHFALIPKWGYNRPDGLVQHRRRLMPLPLARSAIRFSRMNRLLA
jgi:Protein of unknown function (DUF1722)